MKLIHLILSLVLMSCVPGNASVQMPHDIEWEGKATLHYNLHDSQSKVMKIFIKNFHELYSSIEKWPQDPFTRIILQGDLSYYGNQCGLLCKSLLQHYSASLKEIDCSGIEMSQNKVKALFAGMRWQVPMMNQVEWILPNQHEKALNLLKDKGIKATCSSGNTTLILTSGQLENTNLADYLKHINPLQVNEVDLSNIACDMETFYSLMSLPKGIGFTISLPRSSFEKDRREELEAHFGDRMFFNSLKKVDSHPSISPLPF